MPQSPPSKTITLIATHRHGDEPVTLSVQFSESEPDDECPLCQDKIQEADLEFINKSTTVLPKFPHFDKATIASCGHSFHGVALVYHMLKNQMACPICRCGDQRNTLALKSFPRNKVVRQLHDRATELRRQDRMQETEDDARNVLQILRDEHGIDHTQPFATEEFVVSTTQHFLVMEPMLTVYSYADPLDPSQPMYQNRCSLAFEVRPKTVLRICENILTLCLILLLIF